MDKNLLLQIIDNGIEEIKQINNNFNSQHPTLEEIDIAINKTEILLKEFHLLRGTLQKNRIEKIEITQQENIEEIKNEEIKTKDIKELIGINDKFLFLRELFKGNKLEYTESLNKINKAPNIKKAEEIVQIYNWDEKQESTQLFIEILNRKFS